MKIKAYGSTDVGLKRKNNQDSILVENDLCLFAVADGMGGHKGGEIASQMTLDEVYNFYKQNRQMEPYALIEKMYELACEKVYDRSQVDLDLKGMGTTLVLCLFKEDRFYFGNVGDSRAYLYKNNNLWLLTEDHSFVNEQRKKGLIRADEMETHEAKNVITRSVGYERRVQVDILERQPEGEEYYILCSDGLHGLVSDEKILEICEKQDYHLWPDLMIKEAKNAGGDDNISVVAVFSSPGGKQVDAPR